MRSWQKTIKYLAIALAIFLSVSIISGIISTLAVLDYFFDGNKELPIEGSVIQADITEMDIDIAASRLQIVIGDEFRVDSSSDNVSVTATGGKLTIKEKKRYLGALSEQVTVIVSYPKDTAFDKVSINSGAGQVTAEQITTQKLELDLGAGEVNIAQLSVLKKAKIDGGAGAITISDGAIHQMDVDMGVGALTMRAALSGENELSQGVGETNITLLGGKEIYCVEVDKGLGDITVDGVKLKNGGYYGNGANRVEIDGGVGEITVDFE